MSTYTIKGWIAASPAKSYEMRDANIFDGMAFTFWGFKPSGSTEMAIVCEHALTFTVPEGWDPRPQQIAALLAKKAEAQKKFAAEMMTLDSLIANLQALAFEPAEASL